MFKNFKTLDLAILFYQKCEKLKMRGHLKTQLLKASSSISLNLAEGNAKISPKERHKFFLTSYASLKESQVCLVLAGHQDPDLMDLSDHIGACLFKLCRKQV